MQNTCFYWHCHRTVATLLQSSVETGIFQKGMCRYLSASPSISKMSSLWENRPFLRVGENAFGILNQSSDHMRQVR